MEPMVIDPRTGKIRWEVVKARAKFYGQVTLVSLIFYITLFLIWWFRG